MRQQFTGLTTDNHAHIMSVAESKRPQRTLTVDEIIKNNGLMHKSVPTRAAIEFDTPVPSPDKPSTFHAEGLKDAEVEYNSFHSFFSIKSDTPPPLPA